MQIGLAGVAETRFCYAARRANLPYSTSPLNPHTRTSACPQVLTRSSVSTQVINTTELGEGRPSNGSLQNHLSNLEKLIQKKAPAPSILPETTEGTGRDTGRATKQALSLEGFNLGRILWDSKAAAAVEETSRSNLNRLKRLVSTKSVEYSPRNSLCSRWREYHGSNDWVGLLDPLDENLRREVVRYGEFVQAAYHAFHSHPSVTETISSSVSSSSSSSDTVPFHVVLPDKSYKVTSNLYATSSLAMPQWVDDMAPSLGWMTQRSSWIGYVAVCDDKREIARMGRRDIIIALRGTSTCLEWGENLRDFLVDLPIPTREPYSKHNPIPNKGKAKVECGFLSLYKTHGTNSLSLSESIMKEINRLINLYKGEPLSISVTGHSLGAALALLAGDELSSISSTYNIPTAVFSFGGPRVGNRGFANRITENGVKVLRVVNSQDLITQVPGMLCNETLDQKLRVTGLLDEVPWTYAHVGTELRVDTKMSPYLKPNADVACCHDLEAYLHLVDGFLASNCPFRPNAKRSLVTLLSQQGSNVKKLYTKVHAQKTNLHNHQEGSTMSDLRV